MKPMIRKDREITDLGEQLAIIDACDVCRIALMYFHSARRGTKLDLIAQDNRATFEMDCDHQFIFYDERMSCTMGYRSVIGHGLIEILPDEERTHGLDILMRHYHAEEFTYNPKTVPATTVYRLVVTDMVGKFRDNIHPGESRWTPPASSVAAQGHEA